MNSRKILVVALLAVFAAGTWYFLSSDTNLEGPLSSTDRMAKPDGAAQLNPAPGSRPGPVLGNPETDWKRFIDQASGEATAFTPDPDLVARFLAKHGETAVNLIAVFETRRERTVLDRALELFPNSPVVLMAAIDAVPPKVLVPGEKSAPNPERLALIERLKAADPNNPLAWIYSAQELFKSGPNAEAMAEIRAALDRPAFYIYSTERINATARLLEEKGLSPTQAGLVSMAGLTLPHMGAANGSSRVLMELHKNATEAGDAAAANEALRLTYGLGRMFATPEASRLLIGELVGYGMESRALKALPAGSRPDWLNVDPAQRLAEIEKQKEAAKDGPSAVMNLFLESRNEAALGEYLRRMRTESESAAMRWLLQSQGK